MAVRDVITLGYGSFSNVRFVPVLGYLGETAPTFPGVEYALDGRRCHYRESGDRTHYAEDHARCHYRATETN